MTSNSRPAARQCRDYQARTERIVRAAVQTWERMFDRESCCLVFEGATCSDFAKAVKKIVSNCPSDVQEEVLAWQSIKKILPASCRCMERGMLDDLKRKLSSPSRPLPKGYLTMVHRETLRIFRPGWDLGLYEGHVVTTSPPLSSTTECPRSRGGCLGSEIDQSSFLQACLNDVEFDLDVRAKMIVVQSAGKPRALTKFSADTLCLKPLHKAIYDRLSKEKWLNRGDVTTEKLIAAGFSRVEGEVLTSGDYKSATDNMSIEVAETIIRALLSTSVSVPESVKRGAMKILRPNLYSLENDIDFFPTTGQMMGSYLSFPLLCMQNRFSFLFAQKKFGVWDLPCLINGDDILFRSCPGFSQHWMDMVSRLGLEVERTKTSVSESYGTLNSTLILRKQGKYVVKQTVRFGMLAECDDVSSIARTFRDFISGIDGKLRFRAGVEFFRWHLPLLKSQRLTTLELGFRGDLAWRLTRKFELMMCPVSAELPYLGPDHNVVLPKDRCSFVDPALLSKDDKRKSACELASWKFSVEFSSLAKRSKLSFLLKLSEVRPHRPNFLPYLSGFGEGSQLSRYSINQTRRWFSVPLTVRKESFPLMIEPEEQLPPYEDFDTGECLVEVGKFSSK